MLGLIPPPRQRTLSRQLRLREIQVVANLATPAARTRNPVVMAQVVVASVVVVAREAMRGQPRNLAVSRNEMQIPIIAILEAAEKEGRVVLLTGGGMIPRSPGPSPVFWSFIPRAMDLSVLLKMAMLRKVPMHSSPVPLSRSTVFVKELWSPAASGRVHGGKGLG